MKEVLLAADDKNSDYDLGKIRVLIERCGIVITDRKRSKIFSFSSGRHDTDHWSKNQVNLELRTSSKT